MPNETSIESLIRAHVAKESLAHIKMDDDDPRVWAGHGARLWVNDYKNDNILDIALGPNPRREAITQLHAAGYSIVEVLADNLFVVKS